jgi:hypothetical protein
MQSCPTCQYESPAGAKFCRQCGAPLLAESEFSSAATRNYGRQTPAPAVSAPLPPSVGDLFGADTARQHHQPPVYAPPAVSTAPIKATRFRGGHWLGLFLVLFLGIAVGALFASRAINGGDDHFTPAQLAEMDAAAALQAHQQEMADRIREIQDRARETQDQIREAQERAREAAAQAAEHGAAFPSDVKPLDLSPYEYPGASMGNYSRIAGSEMVQLKTKDSFDALIQFYQKKLGKPLMLMKDNDGDNSAFFQSTTTPGVFVSIEADDENEGFWRITITRAPALFPQVDTPPPPPPAPPAPAKP